MPASPAPAIKRHGKHMFAAIEYAGLLLVLIATVVATVQEVRLMIDARSVSVTDLLLLFIYLEIVTMSSVYWRTGRLPVRMPLYVAIVALARHMMLDSTELSSLGILAEAGAILLLGLSVLIVRFGHTRYPYLDEDGNSRTLS
ncbi:MAG TPA: phosphate-starvation-inducible PsiE family protein [Rhodanobacteraceae bacterium]|nr:phosphate-starvation-inducible PsiE family protein [Rhodanobacteraceae bacterium]